MGGVGGERSRWLELPGKLPVGTRLGASRLASQIRSRQGKMPPELSCPWRSVSDAQIARERPGGSNPGGSAERRVWGYAGGTLVMLFHLLSLFPLLACSAGQERAAAAGCPWPAGPGAGPAGCVGSVEDFRASLESGNSSLFSPPPRQLGLRR